MGRIYVKAVRRRRSLLKILINSGSCCGEHNDYDGIVGSRWGGLCGSQSGFLERHERIIGASSRCSPAEPAGLRYVLSFCWLNVIPQGGHSFPR